MNYTLLYQLQQMLSGHLPSLNSWQQANVALFTYGVIEAEGCQQAEIARKVNCGERVTSTARRFRRWLDNKSVDHSAFFAEWSRWVVGRLGSGKVTLLVDETKLDDRIGVMVVGVAWEGRCLPLAWRTYRANCHQSYPAEGQVGMIERLLQQVQAGIGSQRRVLVLADRGIGCSPDLCQAVTRLGWDFLFRVTCQTKLLTTHGEYTIARQVQSGEIWRASGKAFKQRGRIPAEAIAIWESGYDEPWALVTSDEQLTGHEYARRNWQEQSFRDLKSGGWHWGESRIRCPAHVANLLVVLVLAYTWTVALGSQAVEADCAQSLIRRYGRVPGRLLSLFREGLDYFTQFVKRRTVCLDLIFIPDKRFT